MCTIHNEVDVPAVTPALVEPDLSYREPEHQVCALQAGASNDNLLGSIPACFAGAAGSQLRSNPDAYPLLHLPAQHDDFHDGQAALFIMRMLPATMPS